MEQNKVFFYINFPLNYFQKNDFFVNFSLKKRAPEKDSNGKKINCDLADGCSLHLHSVSSKMKFGPVYSSENSIGLMIGTGNVGKYLSSHADKINTYLSRDAGLTWYEVKKGSSIYEVGDHGAIIVLVSD